MGGKLQLAIFDARAGWLALKILARELGWRRALAVGSAIQKAQARGEPFRELDPPESAGEELTRRQARGAILLVRELASHVSPERARDIAGRIVKEASVLFLRQQIPAIDKRQILQMSEQERMGFLQRLTRRFPNAVAQDIEIQGDEAFSFKIKRCLFVDLCEKIGEPEMAGLFCAGDLVFFDREQPQVILTRPSTLSEGGDCCDFRFRWRDQK